MSTEKIISNLDNYSRLLQFLREKYRNILDEFKEEVTTSEK